MYEYDNLPPELRPLSPWSYFGHSILYALPLVGWIFLVIHAIGATNINKRNFARSFFCSYILFVILIVALAASGALSFLLLR